MLADGLNLTTVELDEGEKIPEDLNKFDGMFYGWPNGYLYGEGISLVN